MSSQCLDAQPNGSAHLWLKAVPEMTRGQKSSQAQVGLIKAIEVECVVFRSFTRFALPNGRLGKGLLKGAKSVQNEIEYTADRNNCDQQVS